MQAKYLIIASGCASLLAIVWGWGFLTRVTPAGLAARALSATELTDRANAAMELVSMFNDPAVPPHLRRIVKESRDSQVKVNALNGLTSLRNREDLPYFYEAMEDPDKNIREAGLFALTRTLGVSAEQIGYKSEDPPDKRAEAIRLLRDPPKTLVAEYIGRKDSPVAVAVGPTPPVEGPAPTPSPAPVPSLVIPSPGVYPPPAPIVITESPGILLVAWMWRLVGVLVLLVDVAGAISLFIGDGSSKRKIKELQAARNNPPSVAEEVERILAAKAYGLWPKAVALLAGAICAVALLTVAEFVQMAFRVEQRMDYSSRNR